MRAPGISRWDAWTRRAPLVLLLLSAALVSSAALASLPRSASLDLAPPSLALEHVLTPAETPSLALDGATLGEPARAERLALFIGDELRPEPLRLDEPSYPETRIRAFAFLGSPLIGVSRGVSLELLPGYGRIGLGLAEGDVVNLYAYVGLQPHAATDPTGRCMGLDDIDCSAYLKELGGQLSSPGEIWASAKRSGGFAWNEVGGFVRAPFEAVSGVAELTGSLIGDPRGTTEGLLAAGMQLLRDPGGTLKAAGSGLLNADPEAAAEQAGQILFDIAFTAGTGRVLRAPRMANALEDLARVSKLPKASIGRKITDAFEGSRLVRHADDIGRGARRIDAVEDAGHAARSLRKGTQGARHLDDGLGCNTWTRGIGAAMASFAPETPVATEDGLKPIQSIAPGDEVWALNEKTGKRTLRKVLSTVLHLDDDALEMTAGGESFLTTADHPFFTASGVWVEAAKLKVGQEVQSLAGDLLRVEKVERREGRFAVFNFEVDEDHSYFVGERALLAHNCGGSTRKAPAHTLADLDFVERIAAKAESTGVRQGLGPAGTGHVQGTWKHEYAQRVLKRYQMRTGQKLDLLSEPSYLGGGPARYGTKGSSRPDVFNALTGDIFDYKFVRNPGRGLSPRQRARNLANVPGVRWQHEVNP